MSQQIKLSIYDLLNEHVGGSLDVPARIEVDEHLEFNACDDECLLDIDPLLEDAGQVGILLSTEDMLARRPDLSADQTWEVLKVARGDFFRDAGHLDYLQKVADGMFNRRTGRWRVEARLFVDDFNYGTGKVESILGVLQGQIKALAKDIDVELDLGTLLLQPVVKPEGGAQ